MCERQSVMEIVQSKECEAKKIDIVRATKELRMKIKIALAIMTAFLFTIACNESTDDESGNGAADGSAIELDENGRWTPETATRWWDEQPWLVGCNFVPSTAINQLEMWQEETYDPETIDRELGWAAELGFNMVRVFLHDLLWTDDPQGFTERIDDFLAIADSHGIGVMLVLFDNVWGPAPQLGLQPEPVTGVHNSGWVQSPAMSETFAFEEDEQIRTRLEDYVKGVIERFADDERVIVWDLINEPGNSGILDATMPLLEATFEWAREIRPPQPLTAGVWLMHTTWEVSLYQIEQSDIVSFHGYLDRAGTKALIDEIRTLTERPLICTEYMARTQNSTFIDHLPLFVNEDIGAVNWGLVSGKSQTIYPWIPSGSGEEPEIWFHDIFRPDGSPFDEAEVEFIKQTIDEAHLHED
jgi:Cellulase (glycosyl hydrolase family 5)